MNCIDNRCKYSCWVWGFDCCWVCRAFLTSSRHHSSEGRCWQFKRLINIQLHNTRHGSLQAGYTSYVQKAGPTKMGQKQQPRAAGRERSQLRAACTAQADSAWAHLQAERLCQRVGPSKATPDFLLFSPHLAGMNADQQTWVKLLGPAFPFLGFRAARGLRALPCTSTTTSQAATEHRRPGGRAALPSSLVFSSSFAKHTLFIYWKTISKLPNAPGISNAKLFSTQSARKRLYNHKLVDDYLADLWSRFCCN